MNGFSQNLISYTRSVSQGARELKHLSLSRLRKVFSLMGKNEKIAAAVLLAAALVSLFFSARNFYLSHTIARPDAGGSYAEGLLGQPGNINPILAKNEPDISLVKLVFSGLYKYGHSGELEPDLADGLPKISEDQKQYTINLKPDLKWQNDKPISADDVVFTINLLKDPAYKSPQRMFWQSTTVEKLSDSSLKFTTKDISGPFLDNLTLPILPKNIWGKVDAQNFLLSKFNLEAIGSGPYSIKEIKKLPSGKVQEISLEPNPNYYAEPPKIKLLTFKFFDSENDLLNAFHSREILGFGFIPLGSSLYLEKNQTAAQIITVPLPQYQVIFFNLNNKILQDLNVRMALALATNKDQIISQVFGGNALLPTSPFLFQNQTNPRPTSGQSNPEEAAKILDNSGWKINGQTNLRADKKGSPLEITITTNDTLANSKTAELLAAQWRTLGIQVNLSIIPSKQLTDSIIKPRNFDVLLFPQKFGADPDPFLFWHSSQTKDPGYNLTGFADTQADKLITQARTTTDLNLRQKNYQEFSSLIAAKIPVIFLDQTEFIYALDKKIKNVSPGILYDPSQRFYDVSAWSTAEKRVWK